jgi:hypothetical protein
MEWPDHKSLYFGAGSKSWRGLNSANAPVPLVRDARRNRTKGSSRKENDLRFFVKEHTLFL